MGRVFQPKLKSGNVSHKWVIVYRANGRRVWENTGLTEEKEARRLLKDREGRAAVGAPVLARVDKVRWEEAATDLRTFYETTGTRNLREYTYRVAHLTAFLTGRRIASIKPADVTRYIQHRQNEGAANGTIARELGTLGKLLRLAYENDKLMRLPIIRKPEGAPARKGFFEAEPYEAVRRHLRADLQVVVTIAYTYGWRKQEILRLERRQIDLDEQTIRLDPGSTKNDDGRVVYFTPEVKQRLTEQLARVDALQKKLGRIIPWVFPHLGGGPGQQPGHRLMNFRRAWRTACRKAGVPGHLVHDFRRTAVRNLVNLSVPEKVAMTITGSRSRSVFDRYHIVSPADLQEAARKLSGAFCGAFAAPAQKPAVQVGNTKGVSR